MHLYEANERAGVRNCAYIIHVAAYRPTNIRRNMNLLSTRNYCTRTSLINVLFD